MVAHLSHLPEPEAADRVELTVRFLNSGLARWERDDQEDAHRVAPLTSFTLILSDLAVAMLDAPSSVPLESDAYLFASSSLRATYTSASSSSTETAGRHRSIPQEQHLRGVDVADAGRGSICCKRTRLHRP
jgi:hypothetical protein